MTPEAVSSILSLASDITSTGLLLLVIVGGAKEWWVYGKHYREMREDRDFWRDQALKITSGAERLASSVQAVQKAERVS